MIELNDLMNIKKQLKPKYTGKMAPFAANLVMEKTLIFDGFFFSGVKNKIGFDYFTELALEFNSKVKPSKKKKLW